ncbi:MAG: GntR family transcriptional regulator [Pleurocapsa minor GSE-CHR-MK-17-07R]|jgi:GntR family transcriptional regulator|nr:GntR family transcriptional regulator [Pleurocapsa minor GSE-CHR-MK 17-07R]
MIVLDANSSKPLYEQIKEYILRQIQSGTYVHGERIPSERSLSETLNVNRLTVKKALDELVQAGHLSVQIGKGTYVSQPKFDLQLETLTSFTEEMTRRGQRPSSRVLSAGVLPVTLADARKLSIPPGEPVVMLVRLRLADDVPMAIERLQFVASHCPGILDGHDFSRESLYEVLLHEYGVQLIRAEQSIEARRATSEESRLLEIMPNDPILDMTRVTYSTSGQRVEYTRSAYCGSRYKFQAVLKYNPTH